MPQQNRLSLKLRAKPAHTQATASQNLRHPNPHHTYNSEQKSQFPISLWQRLASP